MALKRGLWLGIWLLNSCMVLVLQQPDSPIPLSLTDRLSGFQVKQKLAHFQDEVWVYYLAGLPNFPLGVWQEGDVTYDNLLADVAKRHAGQGQAVINLRIRHEKTFWTLIPTLVTLGLISPTAVQIEGDVVSIEARHE